MFTLSKINKYDERIDLYYTTLAGVAMVNGDTGEITVAQGENYHGTVSLKDALLMIGWPEGQLATKLENINWTR